jgi:hypothetical protein
MLDTHLSTGAGKIGRIVAGIPNGLSLIPPHETLKNKQIKHFCHDEMSGIWSSDKSIKKFWSEKSSPNFSIYNILK